ncbi:MAG: DeoR/GlpR transcriptional regulator [Verrucomicrobia bacterium]|nr:DeoR/GlpR transcriptional regulator [Verrucomicrobiota bacterium]
MTAEKRRRAILDFLAVQGNVKVEELSKHFEVSEVTIRKDLAELEEQGVLQRTYGGAVFSHRSRLNAPFLERLHVRGLQKQAIAKAAVKHIQEGDCIILDAGSTTLALAQLLASKPLATRYRSLFIITTSVPAALELSRAGHQILLAGGQVRNHSLALIGPVTVRTLEGYYADRAFLGSSGVTLTHGHSTPNPMDAEVKQAMIRSARKSYVLADSSKFGQARLASFARLQDIQLTITDTDLSTEFIDALARREVPLELAEASPGQHMQPPSPDHHRPSGADALNDA